MFFGSRTAFLGPKKTLPKSRSASSSPRRTSPVSFIWATRSIIPTKTSSYGRNACRVLNPSGSPGLITPASRRKTSLKNQSPRNRSRARCWAGKNSSNASNNGKSNTARPSSPSLNARRLVRLVTHPFYDGRRIFARGQKSLHHALE